MKIKQILAVAAVFGMAVPALAADTVNVDLSGYYRLRGVFGNELDLAKDVGNANTAYTYQRLRLEPSIRISENLGIFASMDVLDNVAGGHQDAKPAPLFAGDGSSNQVIPTGNPSSTAPTDTLNIKRVWVEYLIEGVGQLRIGRQPSHFGAGVFSNDGGNGVGLTEKTLQEKWDSYFDDDFGDNHGGSTYDRIIFVTKPMGKTSNLLTGIFWDHLVEGNPQAGSDDVDEYGLVVYYKPNADKDTGNITQGGFYAINRRAYGTESNLWVVDFHGKHKSKPFYAEAELVFLFGESKKGGIPFTTSMEAGIGDITPFLGRVGYDNGSLDARLEFGYSPGDDQLGADGTIYPDCNVKNPGSTCDITTFNFHRDVQVGLLMFPMIIAQNSGFLASGTGAVVNATYLYPSVRYRLSGKSLEGTTLMAALLWAQSNASEQFKGGADGAPDDTDLGMEIDLGVQKYFNQNFRFDLQAGYLMPGKGIPIASDDPDNAYTVQSKFTVVF